MISHVDISAEVLRSKIRKNKIRFAGNKNLKIYGALHCKSGKQMKKENRVFFTSEKEAVTDGFRPCCHCMKNKYITWKNNL